MPSIDTIKKLNELKEELEKLSPAIEHIQKASEVAKSISETTEILLELNQQFIDEIKREDKDYKNDLLNSYKKEFEDLKKQLISLHNNLSDNIKIYEKHHKQIDNLTKTIFEYFDHLKKINLNEKLNSINGQIISLTNTTSSNYSNLNKLIETQSKQLSNTTQENYSKLLNLIETKTNKLNNLTEKNHSTVIDLIETKTSYLNEQIQEKIELSQEYLGNFIKQNTRTQNFILLSILFILVVTLSSILYIIISK